MKDVVYGICVDISADREKYLSSRARTMHQLYQKATWGANTKQNFIEQLTKWVRTISLDGQMVNAS